jgi:hypothetical protein
VESGGGSSEVTRACGTKPGFGTENLIAQAERISWDEIRAAYGRIIDAEIDVKRDNLMEDQLALEIVVQELAAQPARRRETARSR